VLYSQYRSRAPVVARVASRVEERYCRGPGIALRSRFDRSSCRKVIIHTRSIIPHHHFSVSNFFFFF
jgi:hypothetical protein